MFHSFRYAHCLNFDSSAQTSKSPSQKRGGFAAWCAVMAVALFGTWNLAIAQTKASTTTTLVVTSASGPVTTVTSGTVVTLTATVVAGSTAVTPGQVNFCDAPATYCTDIHLLGTSQLNSAGTATLKLRPGLGSHSCKAVFAGTNTYAGSASNAAVLTVTGTIPPLATVTTINQVGSWGTYALSATVAETGNTAPPTGQISFLDTNHGNAALGTGQLGSATRGVNWTSVNTSAPSVAGVSYAVADLNGDGIPDLFIEDYFGTYDVLLGKGDGTFAVVGNPFGPSSETGNFVIGDFNNDGIPDVAAIDADYYAPNNSITIFLGKGDGTFAAASTSPAVGMSPTAIATADINGDGNADLIVSQEDSSGNGQIVIFFGNGDGTFTQSSSIISVASIASEIVPADLNGDGKMDLVLAGVGQSGITILLGNADGTFTSIAGPGPSAEASAGGVALAVADLNNDGIPDLVFRAPSSSALTVFLGNGDGTFTEAPESPNVNEEIGNFAIGDFNQDGIPDIAYVLPNTTAVGVLFGNGDGTFVQTSATITLPWDFGGAFAVGDFNGDGWPDILTEDGNSRTVIDSLTVPTETATATANVSLAAAGQHMADASFGGESDYTASTSGTTMLWGPPPATTTTLTLTSAGSPVTSVTPGTVVNLTAAVMAGASPVTAGQVNFCDATASYCTGAHIVGTATLTSSGAATFKFVPGPGTYNYQAEHVMDGLGVVSTSSPVSLTEGPAPAPVYSDTTSIAYPSGLPGDYSLTATVVGVGGSAVPTGNVSFLDTSFSNTLLGSAALGSATSGMGWEIGQTPEVGGTAAATQVAGDFNGDGIPDLALLWTDSTNTSNVTVFLGKGDGTFTTGPTTQSSVPGQIYSFMISGDFNGDGKTDLALLNYACCATSSAVTTFLGNGDGTFAVSAPSPIVNPGQGGGDYIAGSMVAADFNGDGKEDLAVVGNYISQGGLAILLGNGDGTFTQANLNLNPNADYGLVATGDFNGDGIPDLIATNYFDYGTAPTIFLGKGDGTFTSSAASFTLDYFPTSVVVGDFNGDGILDLAFSDLNGVEIALGKGDGTFKETSASPIQVTSELYSLTAGDFSHHGKLDLAGIDNYNDQIDLLVGAGDGTFTDIVTTPTVSTQFIGPFSIVAADFNEDGVPDLAMLTKYANTATILLTEPTETATATVNGIAPVGAGTHNVEASYAGDSNYPGGVSSTVQLTAGLAPLVITPASGTYTTGQTVTITESIPGATIYYWANGTLNTNGQVQYTGPIQLTEGGSESITAFATETGYQNSTYVTVNYNIDLPAAPAPMFSPTPGNFPGSQQVTISDSANNATIYYTTDGSIPNFGSNVYSGPITVSNSETVVATAIAPGYSMSVRATGTYLIDSASTPFIYTVAGNQANGYTGDGGPATLADLNYPQSAVKDSAGNLYISDLNNNVVRMVAAGTGIITTVAGNGIAGYSGDGGQATSAQLNDPGSLAVDTSGDVYIVDLANNVIRKVAAGTGVITTFAGNSTATSLGDGGPATSANIGAPGEIAVDSSGNLYLAEPEYDTVRKVTAATGIISTVAGSGAYGYAGDGGPALSASFEFPRGVAVDSKGDLYISDTGNNVIRRVDSTTGDISTVAGSGNAVYPNSGFSGDGGPATKALLNSPLGIAVDSAGNFYIADYYDNRIREVSAGGIINTIAGDASSCNSLAGDGGPAASTALCYPIAVSADSSGNLYVEDDFSRVREVTAPQTPPTIAAATPQFSIAPGTYVGAQTVTVSDSTPGAAIYITLNGSTATTAGQGYNGPINVTGNATIGAVAVAPGYLPSTATSAPYTITTPPPTLINTVAGSGVEGFSSQGGPALSAQFASSEEVAIDTAGNLYISDTINNVVWKVAAGTGNISIAAGNGTVGKTGNGGPAASAELYYPEGVAVDSAGNLYIADTGNLVVRKVDAKTGIISVFAGNGQYGRPGAGDGGPATQAEFAEPFALALDTTGDLYISDLTNAVVRMVSAATGNITTVAGNGKFSPLGDGGLATSAAVPSPQALAVDNAGNLFIATTGGRVRKVAAATGTISTYVGYGNWGTSGVVST